MNSDADQFLSVPDVERRVLRAWKTIRAVPDPDRRFLNNGRPVTQQWQIVQDYIDAYGSGELKPRFQPTREDLSDYLRVLDWHRPLSRREIKYIWWRSFDLSFQQIADRIGRSKDTARNRYNDAILMVWHSATTGAWQRVA